jgi:hypothetical protein
MLDDLPTPQSSILLYQTEDGRTRIQCRFENETIWLTQALIAELFQKDVRTINEHLANIFEEGELGREATIRKFRIVRREGTREVAREVEHYSLPAILALTADYSPTESRCQKTSHAETRRTRRKDLRASASPREPIM